MRVHAVAFVLVWSSFFASVEGRAAEFLRFPQGFKWCVATAAHQIEGYNTESDWWDWEQVPGHIRNGEKSGAACDHWNRFPLDTLLMKELHASLYRFSIEWSWMFARPFVNRVRMPKPDSGSGK